MTVVGKEVVDGQQGWWMEVGHVAGQSDYFSAAGATGDGNAIQFHRQDNKVKEEMEKWHPVGTETIIVPAGTFNCARWKKDTGVGDVGVSDKGSPMSMVKSVTEDGSSMTLLKITPARPTALRDQ